MPKFTSGLTPYLILSIVVALFYGNTLFNGFVYDDTWLIVNDPLITSLKNLPKAIFSCHSVVSTTDQCKTFGIYWRPLVYVQLLLTYQISQEPWIFHLVNLMLLWLVAALVYLFTRELLEADLKEKNRLAHFVSKLVAFIVAILVIIHPVNTDVVNFASTNDLHLAIFFLLMCITYIKFSKSGNLKFLVFSAAFYFLTLTSKESGLLLIFVLGAYELFYGRRFKSREYLKIAAFYAASVVFYFLIRVLVLGKFLVHFAGYHNLSFGSWVLSAVEIFPSYLWKLFYPLPLNAQHDPPLVTSLDWRFSLALVGIAAFFGLGAYAVKKRFRLSVLGLCLIFFSILPVLLFINKLGRFIFAERWLFLATLGFSLVIVDIAARLLKYQKVLVVLFCVYFTLCFFVVFNRNRDWHDEFTFNKSIAKYAKTNAGVFYNLGVNFSDKGEYVQAVESYQKSLMIDPSIWQAHNNSANAYLNLDRASEAQGEYQKVLASDPQNSLAKKALDNFALIKSGTESAKLSLVRNSIKYQQNQLIFNYPVTWTVVENYQSVIIKDSDDLFTAEISRDSKPSSLEIGDYLKDQRIGGATLVKEGLAQIPNFKEAYVKVWVKKISTDRKGTDERELTLLEFFLFKNNQVVKVLVFPAESAQMKSFDTVLGSLKLTDK